LVFPPSRASRSAAVAQFRCCWWVLTAPVAAVLCLEELISCCFFWVGLIVPAVRFLGGVQRVFAATVLLYCTAVLFLSELVSASCTGLLINNICRFKTKFK